MKTVAETRTLVVVGARPGANAIDLLGDVPFGGEAVLLVLGLQPTPEQQRLTEDALELAAKRRFKLTPEMISGPSQLHERSPEASIVRIVAGRGERRRWQLQRSFTAPDAR